MSEHDDRYASSDLPRTTAEFRAAPDVSASTAEFKAFVANQDRDEVPRNGPGDAWPEQPWAGEAAKRVQGRTIGIIAAIAAVIVIIAIIVAVG
jgi:hypothetical protein